MKHDSESVDLTMKSREMVLKVRVLKSLFSELRAPVSGRYVTQDKRKY